MFYDRNLTKTHCFDCNCCYSSKKKAKNRRKRYSFDLSLVVVLFCFGCMFLFLCLFCFVLFCFVLFCFFAYLFPLFLFSFVLFFKDVIQVTLKSTGCWYNSYFPTFSLKSTKSMVSRTIEPCGPTLLGLLHSFDHWASGPVCQCKACLYSFECMFHAEFNNLVMICFTILQKQANEQIDKNKTFYLPPEVG